MLVFAATVGIATFIENDYGTSAAQKVVYQAWWFTLLLVLFSFTLIANVLKYRMVHQRKWGLLTLHLSMVIILIGAGITRYYGYEGVMHIREDGTSNTILSSETFLKFQVSKNGELFKFDEPVLFASLGSNDWNESYLVGNDLIEVKVREFIPNPIQEMATADDGVPTLKVVFGGMSGREEYFLEQGERLNVRNVRFNFSEEKEKGAVNILYRNDSLLMQCDRALVRTVMATQLTDTIWPGPGFTELALLALHSDGMNSFVFGDFEPKAEVQVSSKDRKVKRESLTALRVETSINGKKDELLVFGQKGLPGKLAITRSEALDLAISYGSKEIELPFSLKLYDFIMDRYPGTNSAMSFASEVQLIDDRTGVRRDQRIYMNNVLDHDGYRFFQSSYDRDEKGTYLSVNHDKWGTRVSYLGYILLTLGVVLSLLDPKSRFHQLARNIRSLRGKGVTATLVLGFALSASNVAAQKVIEQDPSQFMVSADHADLFSRVVVQDHKGRMKPMHTLTREVLRKLSRKETLNGASADQVVLSMFANSQEWLGIPMIKVGKHERLHELIGVDGELARYKDFFNKDGSYKLQSEMRRANGLEPADRGTLEKELLKVDERVNIANMVFSGHLFRIIPLANDPNNTWVSDHAMGHGHEGGDPTAERFFNAYRNALNESMESGNYQLPDKLLRELAAHQTSAGAAVMPSEQKIGAEIFLNNAKVFDRLALGYALLGMAFLFFLFYSVFRHQANLNMALKVMFLLFLAAFLVHTVGLGIRWYVSGRAPWSNGYESMIYIAWTTALAGLLFSRRSFGGMAATTVLAATILLVAKLSDLDPEITPLVPVLRSYWLTIHVSMEAGSYGFLMLGAIIGLINLILITVVTRKSESQIKRVLTEMTWLSEMTLIGGLFMISIGTFLGGVWANESWGRYWGWDAKETWALVTILVYAFILHMRLIPKLSGLYAYNLATIFGLASVIMTYYGVNYYLSGLHSYAAGDPVPIPTWVYIAVTCIAAISLLAYMRKRGSTVIT